MGGLHIPGFRIPRQEKNHYKNYYIIPGGR